jgi:hypothetical protein
MNCLSFISMKSCRGTSSGNAFTSDFEKIRAALIQPNPDGRTALYDAVAAGLDHLKSGMHDRKALVVLSDGGDNASRRKIEDVLGATSRSFATIYAIGIYDETDPDKNPGVLRRIAHAGGGRLFPGIPGTLDSVAGDCQGDPAVSTPSVMFPLRRQSPVPECENCGEPGGRRSEWRPARDILPDESDTLRER